jgi:hypothetical protein
VRHAGAFAIALGAVLVLLILVALAMLARALNFSVALDWKWISEQVLVLAGLLAIVWQVNRSSENSIFLQRENHVNMLKLEIYKEIDGILSRASDTSAEAFGFFNNFPMQMIGFDTMRRFGATPKVIQARATEFANSHFKMRDSVTSIIGIIEKYEIAIEGLVH